MDRVKRKQLCTRCHNVVVMVRAVRIKSDAGHRLARVDETSDKLRNSNCGFCKLIATIKSPLVDDKPCELRAYSANRTFARVRRPVIQTHNNFTDTVVLGIVPTRGRSFHPYDFIGVLEPRQMSSSCMVGPRKIKPDQINFDLLRSWLSFCGARHGSHCKSSNANEVRSLKVIDCITEKVIKAPENCRYVALSYVWGSDASSLIRDQTTHQRLETFSPVVRDSITVVKELGYQYLWVDKNVCINQDDAAEKHDQIKDMHLVYGNAELTLIAAAGDDSSRGLPGVGSRLREQQQHLIMNKVSYVHTFPRASHILASSTWATRGWTYQEGLLSRRRLIFTDKQVIFQCNGMHCSEAVSWPYELMHRKAGKAIMAMNVPEPPIQFNIERLRNKNDSNEILDAFLLCTEQYSMRNLSHQSDGINAFLGILNLFAKETFLYNIWGVPIMWHGSHLGHLHPKITSRCAIRFDWFRAEPGIRREGFPTWTWMASSERISWMARDFNFWYHNRYSADSGSGNLFKVAIDEGYGTIPLKEFVLQQREDQDVATEFRFLSITASVVALPLKFLRFPEAGLEGYNFVPPASEERKSGLYAEFSTHRGPFLSYLYADDKALDLASLDGKALPAFVVQNRVKPALIVIAKCGNHFERVGFLQAPPDRDVVNEREPRAISSFILHVMDDGLLATKAGGSGGVDWQDRLVRATFTLG